jgi:prevent-host-death family protein
MYTTPNYYLRSMDPAAIIPITEARSNIFDIVKNVQAPNVHYTLTEKGRPKAVIISAEEYASWIETLETMQDFPDIEADIKKAENEFKLGKCISLEEALSKEGLVLSDITPKKIKYVRNTPIKGCRKGSSKNKRK